MTPNSIEAWSRAARRRLPEFAFDFAAGGADDEVTLRRNRQAFDDIALIPRMMCEVEGASAETTLFDRSLAFPVLLGPTGDSRILGPEADFAQAGAAHAAGITSVLSNVASTRPRQLAASVPEPGWAQLFLHRDREQTRAAVEEFAALGFGALVLTVDGPVKGNRERDARHGLQLPLRPTRQVTADAVRERAWSWYWNYFTHVPNRRPTRAGLGQRLRTLRAARHAQMPVDPRTLAVNHSWDDLEWLRTEWQGPLLLKGVMCAEDAERAVAAGCDGVIVTNHGGRQLDSSPAAIEMLPEVVAAVGQRATVLVDGGFRRGTDVVKALCLGASACLIARPWLFALAAGGEAGITRMLHDFQAEIIRAMQLVGASHVSELGPTHVRRRPGSGWAPVLAPAAREV